MADTIDLNLLGTYVKQLQEADEERRSENVSLRLSMDALLEGTRAHLAALGADVRSHGLRLANIERAQTRLAERVGDLTIQVGTLRSDMIRWHEELRAELVAQGGRIDRLETRMDGLEERMDRLETKVDALSDGMARILAKLGA